MLSRQVTLSGAAEGFAGTSHKPGLLRIRRHVKHAVGDLPLGLRPHVEGDTLAGF